MTLAFIITASLLVGSIAAHVGMHYERALLRRKLELTDASNTKLRELLIEAHDYIAQLP